MSAPNLLILNRILKTGSLFALATGLLDITFGHGMLGDNTAFPPTSPTTANIDSQIRFFGSVWAGYGAMLWWASNDLRERNVPLAILGAVMLVGGVGRAISTWKFGFGAAWIRLAMWAELIGPGAIYLLGRMEGVWV